MRQEDYQIMHELESTYWWFEGMREIVKRLLLSEIKQPPSKFLDVGCGTGIMLHWFPEQFHAEVMVGCDLSEVAIRYCLRTVRTRPPRGRVLNRAGLLLLRGSILELPLGSNKFDVVTNLDVLDSVPLDGGDVRALGELHRVLRPGGVALVRAPAYQWLMSGHDHAFESLRRFSAAQLAASMRRAGFDVTRTTYANTLLFPLALTRRLLRKVGVANKGTDTRPWPRALRWLNRPMTSCLYAEARLLRRGFRLPFGLSAICIGRK